MRLVRPTLNLGSTIHPWAKVPDRIIKKKRWVSPSILLPLCFGTEGTTQPAAVLSLSPWFPTYMDWTLELWVKNQTLPSLSCFVSDPVAARRTRTQYRVANGAWQVGKVSAWSHFLKQQDSSLISWCWSALPPRRLNRLLFKSSLWQGNEGS